MSEADLHVEDVVARAAADFGAGRMMEAEAGARAALAAAPRDPGALHVLAACRAAAGDLDEAAALLAAVLEVAPENDDVRLQLAELRSRQGRHEDVVAVLEPAVSARPGFVAARLPLARAQWQTGAREAAIANWRAHVAREPDDGKAVLMLADAVRMAGAAGEAVALARRATGLLAGKDDPGAWTNARLALAESLLQEAAAKDVASDRLRAHEEAAGIALSLWREGVGGRAATLRLGSLLAETVQMGPAIACHRSALEQGATEADLRLNLALLQLKAGDFAEGWHNYEARRPLLKSLGPFRAPEEPWVAPADLAGQTVRVVLEQGVGDALHFLRYLPLLAARGARVEVCAPIHASLRPLLAAMPGVAAIVDNAAAEPVPPVVVPLLSLPLAFGTTLATIPAPPSYLPVPEPRRCRWRRRLEDEGDRRPRVGVMWFGNPVFRRDRHRSIPLAQFRRLMERNGLAFHVLGPAVRPGDAALLEGRATLHDGIEDFADTAALAEMMDLVISVDTAVAHLAGALGRPVWILQAWNPDWRWLLGRDDSPWYPSMRLFRQSRPDDWDTVLTRVGEALHATFG